MKQLVMLLGIALFSPIRNASAQTAEVTQLILNIEKLNELRKILKQLKEGYQILLKGYSTIKDLSEGNFKLHEAFLDGLLLVSPAVKNYARIKDIIEGQLALVQELNQAHSRLSSSGHFSQDEIAYMDRVYDDLAVSSLKSLDALTAVLTAKKLRASDDERLRTIDQIYEEMTDKLSFLRHFNGTASMLASQRENEVYDVKTLEALFDLKP